jgi:hypothetical protein
MYKILKLLRRINYKRDNPVTLTIQHVYPSLNIAGTINAEKPLSFSTTNECIRLLETRFG